MTRMASWVPALILRERLSILRSKKFPEIDQELAERRWKRWQLERVFAQNSTLLAERLAADGIAQTELHSLLGIPSSEFAHYFDSLPGWACKIADVCDGRATSDDAKQSIEKIIQESTASLGKTAGFLRAASGFISQAREQLRSGIDRIKKFSGARAFAAETTESILLPNALTQVLGMLNRTFVLELNVARIQGLLSGETPEERFASFIERLSSTEVVAALWEEYPALARQIVFRLQQWVDTNLEFLERLENDWTEIQHHILKAQDPGQLVKLNMGAGDRHHNGRSVAIAEFSSGCKLVYKPRSLALDIHFQELLHWVNAHRNSRPPFRILSLLAKNGYGWTEYVDSGPCNNEDEVKRFYWRQGGFLALLYALHATDFHFENLVACGEHPVLVDLETLFHPDLHSPQEQDASFLGNQEIINSVFRTGLLPFRFAVNEEQQEGAEISGLGGAAGQKTPHPVPGWEGLATDAMRFIRKRVEIPPQRNRPRLQNSEISALHYVDDIVDGFTSTYKLFETHRNELLAPEGPLASFAQDPVRCIVRPTATYSNLLSESYHPNLLRDALDRDRFFDNLWADAEFNPLLKNLIRQEREDLWAGDIPVFSTLPDSPHLYDSHHQAISGHQHEPSFSLVQKRLNQLGTKDLERQVWFIRAAMTALSIEDSSQTKSIAASPEVHRLALPVQQPVQQIVPQDFLQAAIAIGDHLCQSAIIGAQNDVAWIGLDLVKDSFWELTVTGSSLYSGISGIGLFFVYLAEVTGEYRFSTMAQQIVTTLLRGIQKQKDKTQPPIGAFTGTGSVIYFLTHCGTLWRNEELLDEAERLASLLAPAIPNDKSLDVISGSAGLIAVLLNLHDIRHSNQTLELALQCGDHLLRHGKADSASLTWLTLQGNSQPLTGFSHGAAGIAWALMKLAATSGEQRFRAAAIQALRYERNLFSGEQNNWPDLRDSMRKPNGPSCAIAWCHGAPGIGLGRIDMLQHYQDSEIEQEIQAAVQTTSAHNIGASQCLCHGDLGNLETLLEAEKILKEPTLTEKIQQHSAAILANIQEHGWRCGVPLGVETPGLMVGTAGIGYGLLRLAAPQKVPSVLSLASPRLGKTTDCSSQRFVT